MEKLLTVKEAAEITGLNQSTMNDLARSGYIAAQKPAGRWIFSESSVKEFAAIASAKQEE